MAGQTQDAPSNSEHDAIHAAHIEETLQELQAMVDEHQDALNKLRASSAINSQMQTPSTVVASLDTMKAAYDDLTSKTPFLPFPDSVLPALVALQRTHQTVEETKAFLSAHGQSIEETKKQLQDAKTDFKNQQALAHSLRTRIQSLQNGLNDRMEMSPDDIARERINELKEKKKKYDKDSSKLLRSLRKFIDTQLAGMLAAEELGGPVVGDLMDIDEEDLAGGFNAQGRAKKRKVESTDGKRQRRIDEIWGAQDEDEDGSRNEITAAGQEMRDLTEELLNSLWSSEGDSSAAYVQLAKESAAARFLVRAKVAQFHPKDSSKLRLIDFGRELDD
ncbi:hypothetical protein F5Y16DRAFT_33909 [Xylariaceae sp. FL0255]|nr:hypothetical protein F5Y16DRAFT_33909 [Xylariaceae sp. FL0255]